MVVYIDLLVAVNWLIDGLLLASAAAVTGLPPLKKGRLLIASFLAALSSLVLLLPTLPAFLLIALRLALSLGVSFLVLGRTKPATYFLFFFWYYLFSLLLGGIWQFADSFFSPAGLLFHNQTVYFHLTFFQAALLVAGVYFTIKGLSLLRQKSALSAQKGELVLQLKNNSCRLPILVDSGNFLLEPVAGRPVALCHQKALAPLFSNLPSFATEHNPTELLLLLRSGGITANLLPFEGVANGGIVTVFYPDKVFLEGNFPAREGDWCVGILPDERPFAFGARGILRLNETIF